MLTYTAGSSGESGFMLGMDDKAQRALDVLNDAGYHRHTEDPDQVEYFVRVSWLEAVPLAAAYSETGFFGNQNSVCKPTATRWRSTVERLKKHFVNWDSATQLGHLDSAPPSL
jgi:hypothetical protein